MIPPTLTPERAVILLGAVLLLATIAWLILTSTPLDDAIDEALDTDYGLEDET